MGAVKGYPAEVAMVSQRGAKGELHKTFQGFRFSRGGRYGFAKVR